VAYGARLESVLGSRPRGFESRILRSLSSTNARVTRSRGARAFVFGLSRLPVGPRIGPPTRLATSSRTGVGARSVVGAATGGGFFAAARASSITRFGARSWRSIGTCRFPREKATNGRAPGFTKALAWAAGPPVEWTVVREPRPGASSSSVPSGEPGRTCRQGDEGERSERQASMRLSLTLRSVRGPAGDAGPRSSQPAVRRSPRWDRHQYRAGRSRRSGRGSRRPR
jgi:hypothetical protein